MDGRSWGPRSSTSRMGVRSIMYYILLSRENGYHEDVGTFRTVLENIPEFIPEFPDIPIEQRYSAEFLQDTIKSDTKIPQNWWYLLDTEKFIEPLPFPPTQEEILTEFALGLMGVDTEVASEPNEQGLQTHQDISRSRETGAIAMVVMAERGLIDDVTITENADLFPVWAEEWAGRTGVILADPDTEQLYQKTGDAFEAPHPESQPSVDKENWRFVGDPAEEFPLWVEALGIHDAYTAGTQVTHDVRRWVSDMDDNIWMPGVKGWTEVIRN